jgi:cell division septation protein DedD
MMTERRYGFRFSGVEGGLLIGSILLASFLIFVSGVYVGREVAGRKVVAPSQVVRARVSPLQDPVAVRTTPTQPTNDAGSVRTAATSQTPMAWPPVAREKTSPAAPPLPRAETSQQVEKEKLESAPPVVSDTPAMRGARTVTSPVVDEDQMPRRTKPAAEPVVPKLPVAVATRTEKRLMPAAAREERGRKKSEPVTIAHVEKVEPTAHPRALAPETKRPVEGKSAEVKRPQETAKKAVKAASSAWRVQVGATTYQETAQDMARELRELGYRPSVSKVQINGETLYRVRIGSFGKQGEAAAAVGRFRREGRFSQAYLVTE